MWEFIYKHKTLIQAAVIIVLIIETLFTFDEFELPWDGLIDFLYYYGFRILVYIVAAITLIEGLGEKARLIVSRISLILLLAYIFLLCVLIDDSDIPREYGLFAAVWPAICIAALLCISKAPKSPKTKCTVLVAVSISTVAAAISGILMSAMGLVLLTNFLVVCSAVYASESAAETDHSTSRKRIITARILLVICLPLIMTGIILRGATYNYVDTGIMINWEKYYDVFKYKGVEYIDFDFKEGYAYSYEETDYRTDTEGYKKVPEFNICDKVSKKEAFWYGTDKDTAYNVKNDSGCSLYLIDYSLYCPKSDVKKVRDFYYGDHYPKWKITIEIASNEKDVSQKIFFNKKDISFMQSLDLKKPQNKISRKESEKYKEKIFGTAADISIKKYSSDNVAEGEMKLYILDGCWYAGNIYYDEGDKVYKLPNYINKKLNEALEKSGAVKK